jgi:hypothetical protein
MTESNDTTLMPSGTTAGPITSGEAVRQLGALIDPEQDRPLFDAWCDFLQARTELDSQPAGTPDAVAGAIYAQASEARSRLLAAPARTLEGLAQKLKALFIAYGEEGLSPDEIFAPVARGDEPSADALADFRNRGLWQACRDAERMGRECAAALALITSRARDGYNKPQPAEDTELLKAEAEFLRLKAELDGRPGDDAPPDDMWEKYSRMAELVRTLPAFTAAGVAAKLRTFVLEIDEDTYEGILPEYIQTALEGVERLSAMWDRQVQQGPDPFAALPGGDTAALSPIMFLVQMRAACDREDDRLDTAVTAAAADPVLQRRLESWRKLAWKRSALLETMISGLPAARLDEAAAQLALAHAMADRVVDEIGGRIERGEKDLDGALEDAESTRNAVWSAAVVAMRLAGLDAQALGLEGSLRGGPWDLHLDRLHPLAEDMAEMFSGRQSDSFADTVAGFASEGTSALALPGAPTEAMVIAGAKAAGCSPEDLRRGYDAMVAAYAQERAA